MFFICEFFASEREFKVSSNGAKKLTRKQARNVSRKER